MGMKDIWETAIDMGIDPQEYLETIMQKVPIPELLEEAANIPAQQAPVKESK
jgi:hypothetical protein